MVKLLKTNKAFVVLMAVVALSVMAVPIFAAPLGVSVPTLDIDFTAALQTIFDYAMMIFTALIPIAAIGIGFRFGAALLGWVGDMLGSALKFR